MLYSSAAVAWRRHKSYKTYPWGPKFGIRIGSNSSPELLYPTPCSDYGWWSSYRLYVTTAASSATSALDVESCMTDSNQRRARIWKCPRDIVTASCQQKKRIRGSVADLVNWRYDIITKHRIAGLQSASILSVSCTMMLLSCSDDYTRERE